MYQYLLKPFFFLFPPERAHHLTLRLFKIGLSIPGIGLLLDWLYAYHHPNLKQQLFGLTFENPVGLAAGFDKDGKHYRSIAKLGFGFVELGTVTPRPQPGNPQPRLFRLPADDALINRLGFNNDGVEALVQRLQRHGKPEGLIIGGNIGKNKTTPNEQAAEDYKICFEALFPYVDYFVVNVSSPNTPNLRALQDKEPLSQLLHLLQQLNRAKGAPKPLLLKIAPDLTDGQLDDILDIVEETQIDGLSQILGLQERGVPQRDVFEAFLDGLRPAGAEHGLGALHREGRVRRDRFGHLAGGSVQVFRRRVGVVDQADCCGPLGGDVFAGVHEFGHVPFANDLRKPLQRAQVGNHRQARFPNRETGVAGGEADVARRR